jgi:hypothetical protein
VLEERDALLLCVEISRAEVDVAPACSVSISREGGDVEAEGLVVDAPLVDVPGGMMMSRDWDDDDDVEIPVINARRVCVPEARAPCVPAISLVGSESV